METKYHNYVERFIINENIQMADKVYFNTSKLTNDDKNLILGITHGDNYTKIMCDFYYFLKFNSMGDSKERLASLYNDLVNYNKNVYPIGDFDINKVENISLMIRLLEIRRKIIDNLKQLPSFAVRNMKADIRKIRGINEMTEYLNDIEYFVTHYSYLSNRDKSTREKILKKMFKSETSIEDLMRFVDDKQSFIGGVEFTKDDVKKMSETEDVIIVYEQGDVMIVQVYSPDGIKAIGCNSLWCFTYGSGYNKAQRDWYQYSYNGMVYVIIDFREDSSSKDFMHVLISPLTDDGELIEYDEDDDNVPLYDMANDNYNNPYSVLKYIFGENYQDIIEEYLNFY